jgi:DNA/RNA endonuclease YhcR with UshA esterase domain
VVLLGVLVCFVQDGTGTLTVVVVGRVLDVVDWTRTRT